MEHFTISQIARYSGIKPHTIRAWEQRYNALNPNRSDGNTRYYDNNQLIRLLNIVSLRKFEYKVSELCSMPDEKLSELIGAKQIKHTGKTDEYLIAQLIAAGMDFNEVYFEKIFSHCLLRYRLKGTYIKVIYPMLHRLGLMWATKTMPSSHEHFISNLIRQKLFTAIDSLPPAKPMSDKWLLFLPEDEFHELGLLFANYLIRSSRKKVIYLGNNVPLQSLSAVADDSNPDNILLFLVHNDLPKNIDIYFDKLINRFTQQKIFVSAKEELINKSNTSKEIIWLKSAKELERKL